MPISEARKASKRQWEADHKDTRGWAANKRMEARKNRSRKDYVAPSRLRAGPMSDPSFRLNTTR